MEDAGTTLTARILRFTLSLPWLCRAFLAWLLRAPFPAAEAGMSFAVLLAVSCVRLTFRIALLNRRPSNQDCLQSVDHVHPEREPAGSLMTTCRRAVVVVPSSLNRAHGMFLWWCAAAASE